MNWKATLATIALTIGAGVSFTMAQDNGGGNTAGGNNNGGRQREGGNNNNGGDRGGDRGGRNFDPAEMQKRMMERFKEQLKSPDDEWAIIQPKLQKVLDAQRESRAGGMFGGGGFGGRRGGPGGDANNQPQDNSALATASRELRTALEKENASPEEINTKLTAYREAREKARANLEAARKDLKEVLSARQEAALVIAGILE